MTSRRRVLQLSSSSARFRGAASIYSTRHCTLPGTTCKSVGMGSKSKSITRTQARPKNTYQKTKKDNINKQKHNTKQQNTTNNNNNNNNKTTPDPPTPPNHPLTLWIFAHPEGKATPRAKPLVPTHAYHHHLDPNFKNQSPRNSACTRRVRCLCSTCTAESSCATCWW